MQGILPPAFNRESSQLNEQSQANLRNNDISASLLLQSTSNKNNNIEPSQLQYKIQKLLQDNSRRQEKYINFIKEQKEKSYEMTEMYLNSLKKYKQELDNYIENRKGKQIQKFQKYKTKSLSMNPIQIPVNKYKKIALQPQEYNSKQNQYQVHLNCGINFIYFTPLIQDYISETFPQELQFIVQTQYPYKKNGVIGKVMLQQDVADNIDNLINEYPFQLITIDGSKKRVKIQFNINNEAKTINFYKKNQLKIRIQNKYSQMIYGEAMLQTEQFLYYSSDSTQASPQRQSWNQKVQFYCPFSHKLVAYVHMELQNIPVYLPSTLSSRIQSTQPLQLTSLKVDNTLYGDKQSRMIQRINKYKSATNSLLLSHDLVSNNAVDKELLFQNSNDKTLVMHRHKKELQFVNKYKEDHRGEYMQKVMHQALDKFCLDDLQMGVPKFIPFYYKSAKSPQKILIIPTFNFAEDMKSNSQTICTDIQTQINVSIVPAKSLQSISQKGLFKWNKQYGWEYELDGQSNNVWTLSQSVVFVIKILATPNKQLQKIIEQTKYMKNFKGTTFQLKLAIQSEFGQNLSQQLYKLQFKPLVIMNQLTFHNYQDAEEQIHLPIGQVQQNQFKLLSTDNLEFRWQTLSSLNQSIQYLIIKYKFFKRAENSLKPIQKFQKMIDLTILDEKLNFPIKTFRLNIFSYPKIKNLEEYTIGEVKNYKFPLQFNENSISQSLTSSTQVSTINKKMFRLAFHSSNSKHAIVKCQAKKELLCDINKVYQMELKFQSFQNTEEQRIVVHAVDTQNLTIMKRWLFKFQKKFQDYQHVFTIKVKHSKPLIYNYALRNFNTNERSYKFYSSNNSILAVPQNLVLLNGSQNTQIKMEINVKRSLKEEQKEKGVHIIVRIQEENGKRWNQLFRLMVSE